MSKSHTLKRKSFVPRDMTIQKRKIAETLFSRRAHRVRREKRVTRKNIDWIAVSRGTNVLALRNTFHSVYQLQGSAAAEHPKRYVWCLRSFCQLVPRRSADGDSPRPCKAGRKRLAPQKGQARAERVKRPAPLHARLGWTIP